MANVCERKMYHHQHLLLSFFVLLLLEFLSFICIDFSIKFTNDDHFKPHAIVNQLLYYSRIVLIKLSMKINSVAQYRIVSDWIGLDCIG